MNNIDGMVRGKTRTGRAAPESRKSRATSAAPEVPRHIPENTGSSETKSGQIPTRSLETWILPLACERDPQISGSLPQSLARKTPEKLRADFFRTGTVPGRCLRKGTPKDRRGTTAVGLRNGACASPFFQKGL